MIEDPMYSYYKSIERILNRGESRGDRTGVGTYSKFGVSLMFNVHPKSFPIVTRKKIFFKGITTELCWFLKGMTNVEYLQEHGVDIWNEWAGEDGELGPVYGAQLRSFMDTSDNEGVDQLQKITEQIRNNPESRRHVITLWNPAQLDDMELPPCHGIVMQFYVSQGERLDMTMYQRSGDMFLGVPFNITSYSLLLSLVADQVGLKTGTLYHHIGDAHVYKNHTDQVEKMLDQERHALPSVDIDFQSSYEDYEPEHFSLDGYEHGPIIRAPVAV